MVLGAEDSPGTSPPFLAVVKIETIAYYPIFSQWVTLRVS